MPRHRRFQNRRSGRFGQTVGNPEESPFHELRQNVTCLTLLLSRQHLAQSARRTSLLPVSVCIRNRFLCESTQLTDFLLNRFLRNPTELKSIKNISLLRQQPPPQAAIAGTHASKLNEHAPASSSSIVQPLNTHQLSHLSAVAQQQQQVPPSSPRVHALNGAFHHLSTSSEPERSSPHSHSLQLNPSNPTIEFKMEPSIDIDDMPTDLSTGGDRRSNADCYP